MLTWRRFGRGPSEGCPLAGRRVGARALDVRAVANPGAREGRLVIRELFVVEPEPQHVGGDAELARRRRG